LVIQKSTQIGLTVWSTLAQVWMAKAWAPLNIASFVPDQASASFLSSHRWLPIIRSIPSIFRELVVPHNIMTRQLGTSLFRFLWTSGTMTTESFPADVAALDEVQGMELDAIDKVMARMGDSTVRFTMMLSTARYPDLDINAWYQLGTQEVWHTRCPHCDALSDLSDPIGIFPSRSIAYNGGQFPDAPEDYVWTCPECSGWIADPQAGEYVVKNPGADPMIRSFLLPRTISPRMTAREMYVSFSRARTGAQKESFYNRTLARPYIDAEKIPVTIAHCEACVEEGRRMGLQWEKSAEPGGDYYLGIDQMGSFNIVVVKKRLRDGRQGVVHIEAIYDNDPFARCGELMDSFNITLCVTEQLPNANDARRFANKYRGRVYLAGYADLRDDMIVWGDAITRSDRKTVEEDRSRWSVSLNQYRCMQTSLYRVRDKFCLFPDPDLLVQGILENGEWKLSPILRDLFWLHLTKTALIIEEDEETRKRRPKVLKIGIDPHFSYANLCVDVAWARVHGASQFIIPESGQKGERPKSDTPLGEKVTRNMPGFPVHVANMMDQGYRPGTCSGCVNFKADINYCNLRMFTTEATAVSCEMFDPK
jgi:hypothetical protein